MTSLKRTACLIIFFLTLASGASALSPYADKGRGLNGVKGGIIGRANLDSGNVTFQTKISVSLGLFWDAPFAENWHAGVAVDLHNLEILDQRQFFLDISLPIKYVFFFTGVDMAVKPVVALGYGHLAESGILRSSDYLTLKVFVETHFLQPRKRAWVVEVGMFHAPYGGNGYASSSVGPAALLRIGYIF